MNKKVYIQPSIKAIMIDSSSVICNSDTLYFSLGDPEDGEGAPTTSAGRIWGD